MKNKTQKEREEFIKEFFGFSPKGIVDYISGRTPTGYHSASAICNNCGAKAKDTKQADEWQFGHPDCPKPNGLYVRNDVGAEDIVKYHLEALSQKEEEVRREVLEEVKEYQIQVVKDIDNWYDEHTGLSKLHPDMALKILLDKLQSLTKNDK